jgi:hypothetical protein
METGNVKVRLAPDASEFDFAIDTALSWEGRFPKVGSGDFVVKLGSDAGESLVLVSRRYVEAMDHNDAASIALDAFLERKGIPVGDAWVESVLKVGR